MTPCNIVFHHSYHHGFSSFLSGSPPSSDHGHYATARVVAHCETHGVRLLEQAWVAHDTICPIGRIEQATDKAIAAIRAELKHLNPTGPSSCA